MSMLTRKIIAGLLLASAWVSGQAQTQIQTTAVGREHEAMPPSDLEKFSSATPCYVYNSKEYPDAFASIVKGLKESGFNIVNDSHNVTCFLRITGYATVPSKTAGSVPINVIYILNNRDNKDAPHVIGPALNSSGTQDAAKIAGSASGLAKDPIDASGINVLTQAGSAINGMQGSIVGAVIGTLANVVSGIQSRQETPSGVVYINAELGFGGFFTRNAIVVGAYAASTKPESPEDLIDAGVKRVAQAIWERTAAYDKAHGVEFTMPTIQQGGVDTTKQGSATGQDAQTSVGTNPVAETTQPTEKAPATPDAAPVVSAKPAQDTAQATGAK